MPPKKRGRKPSKKKAKDNAPKVHKKRGRKPKGGKIVPNINSKIQTEEVKKPNIILQLKCSSSDIDDVNNSIDISKYEDTSIKSYNIEKSVKQKNKINYQEYNTITYKKSFKNESKEDNNSSEQNKVELKVIWDKLKTLKLKLHLNEMADKRSSCFWCTCQFSNPAVYIPKQQRNNITEVYG